MQEKQELGEAADIRKNSSEKVRIRASGAIGGVGCERSNLYYHSLSTFSHCHFLGSLDMIAIDATGDRGGLAFARIVLENDTKPLRRVLCKLVTQPA